MSEVIHAYRHIYRTALRAVQYSSPARTTVRNQIRHAFRDQGASLNKEAVKRTVWFLQAAAGESGLEHKILKNLLKVQEMRSKNSVQWRQALHQSLTRDQDKADKDAAFRHYDMTVAMLNQSMGLCLR